MDPNATLRDLREAISTLAGMLDVDIWDGSAEHDEAVQGLANDVVMGFKGLDTWLDQGGFLPAAWRKAFHTQPQSTPTLVREFTDIKCADARGEPPNAERHRRLGVVVDELRKRGVLD